MKILPVIAIVVLLTGCVSKTTHAELTERTEYYKRESMAADSLRLENAMLFDRNRNLEADLNRVKREWDLASMTNNALVRNYDELLANYNRVVGSSYDMVSTSAYEKQSLTERLAAQ